MSNESPELSTIATTLLDDDVDAAVKAVDSKMCMYTTLEPAGTVYK